MISRQDVEKLLGVRAGDSSVLSLYIAVPRDPDARRGLAARAGELFSLAEAGPEADGGPATRIRPADRRAALDLLDQHARDWLGHSVAIFVSGQTSLAQPFKVLCELPERAVLAARPHVRPLLLALQRCPSYRIAVIDRRHAWVLGVRGEQISTISQEQAAGVRSPGFGGWWGLDSHRVHERMIQLARHHFHDTAALLERVMRAEPQPLVVAGHDQTIPEFTALLPANVRDHVAGSFVADPHTLTPARARALATPVIDGWVRTREDRLVLRFLQEPPGPLTVLGLSPCLAAVNQHAVQLLLVPVGGVVPGYVCARCGALSATSDSCPQGHAEPRPVPDLLEEMAVKALADSGEVAAVHEPPGEVAARLRFAVPPGTGTAPAGTATEARTELADTLRRS